MKITKETLKRAYLIERKSVSSIAEEARVSQNKINYWISKYDIPKRSISDALYLKHNPNGDPFKENTPNNIEQAVLYGVGIGLYWGEGNKRNKSSVRLGNTDPKMIKIFILFLENNFGVNKDKLRFGLQIFSDTSADLAKKFWMDQLKVSKNQFQKVVVTPSRGEGTYKYKSKYGVLTVYFNNTKLRNIICSKIENLQFL